jgi:hypothetical protein
LARGYEIPEMDESESEDLASLTLGQILRRKTARDIAKRQADGPVIKVASDEDDHK